MLTKAALRLASMFADDDDDGQGLAEYALILALIAIVAVAALMFLGTEIGDKLSDIGQSIADL